VCGGGTTAYLPNPARPTSKEGLNIVKALTQNKGLALRGIVIIINYERFALTLSLNGLFMCRHPS